MRHSASERVRTSNSAAAQAQRGRLRPFWKLPVRAYRPWTPRNPLCYAGIMWFLGMVLVRWSVCVFCVLTRTCLCSQPPDSWQKSSKRFSCSARHCPQTRRYPTMVSRTHIYPLLKPHWLPFGPHWGKALIILLRMPKLWSIIRFYM